MMAAPVRGERTARGGRCRRIEVGLAPTEQDVWKALRERGELSSTALSGRRDDVAFCREYLQRLVKAGLAEVIGGSSVTDAVRVRLRQDAGPIAPRLTISGKPSFRGRHTAALWQAMRTLKVFSANDLTYQVGVAGIPVSAQVTRNYIRVLRLAGYIRVLSQGSQHRPGQYSLLPQRNSGMLPPRVISLRVVIDDNTGESFELEAGHD